VGGGVTAGRAAHSYRHKGRAARWRGGAWCWLPACQRLGVHGRRRAVPWPTLLCGCGTRCSAAGLVAGQPHPQHDAGGAREGGELRGLLLRWVGPLCTAQCTAPLTVTPAAVHRAYHLCHPPVPVAVHAQPRQAAPAFQQRVPGLLVALLLYFLSPQTHTSHARAPLLQAATGPTLFLALTIGWSRCGTTRPRPASRWVAGGLGGEPGGRRILATAA
jgi:hypothetical protein